MNRIPTFVHLCVGHNTSDFVSKTDVYLKIDVDGLLAQCLFSEDNLHWERLGPNLVIPWQDGYFTAFHPGLFAGQTVETLPPGYADFDYIRMENHERP